MTAVAVDTSVAIPLMVSTHPAHVSASAWAGGRSLALGGHALAETYAVLTRLPGDARVAAADAVALIDETFGPAIVLSAALSRKLHRDLARLGIAGGAVYDGLVAAAARQAGLTLATRDARARGTYEALGVRVELLQT